MLWCILYLPEAEFLCGTGNISCNNGFYEQLYTNVALFSSKESAQQALNLYFQFNGYKKNNYTSIKEHYEIIQYEHENQPDKKYDGVVSSS